MGTDIIDQIDAREMTMRYILTTALTVFAIAAAGFALLAQDPENTGKTPVPAPKPAAVRIPAEHLPNVVRLHPRVYSGGVPHGEAGFRELRELGVRTVISVDGMTPDVAAAQKYGLEYVHLPHGYDGIPEDIAADLAKAVSALPGPVYIHCHHGKNRSPAAAAVGCVGAGYIAPEQAVDVLEIAGTSEHYHGLYEAADQMRPISRQRLANIPTDFPEVAEIPPMAEAMVHLEHTFARMKSVREANWQTPAHHPDVEPAHEALLLREHFTELLRTDDVKQRPAPFRKFLQQSEQAGLELEAALRKQPPATNRAQQALNKIAANCAACHNQFRDVPLE